MEIGSGVGVVASEGVHACVAVLDALAVLDSLDREDSFLVAGAGVGSGVDVLERRYEIRLERLEVISRLEAQLAAVKARDVTEALQFQQAMTPPDASVQDRTYTEMSVVEEVAGVLTISSAAAGAFVDQSRRVCSLPRVFEALSAGAMSWQHARVVADESEGLDPAGAAGLVAHFFDPDAPSPARGAAPGELVPSRFRAKVRAWRERHHPETLEKRHAKGVADRRMEYTPDKDGMAWVSLYLPGDTACAIWNRATARGLQGPDEPRTLTQLRPDIAASLLLGAGSSTELGEVPTPRADVLVMVPVFALFGVTDEPAILDGFGPIPAAMARKLVADGADSFYRVLVDPRDGAPLEIGRKNYRLTETIKRWIRMRDGKCTFPGCTNKTPDNETDHLTAWEHGGTTGISNLAQLCPKHHRLKHHNQWTPDPATQKDPPGWTSPTGRHYKPEQPDPEPTHWPPRILPVGPVAGANEAAASPGTTAPDASVPPNAAGPSGTAARLRATESEDEDGQWQQLLADMPAWPDPPPEEPTSEYVIDPTGPCASDPRWVELLAMPAIPVPSG
ncbi:hypothetical protein QF031_003616 [Pseudarthrobacter defluvii]|uniref:HNH endonuclease signature motif containing protein n=1 Tax=Pseudarthrobacter defluvii TaxID=410837 RepID=UPI0027886A48|nr:HNH endonuclease signature motif containing protein [Pseudarthrobacter defluvii]MDQ0770867.1 hypothetical protein [Pseudarthrobacter defluvii]